MWRLHRAKETEDIEVPRESLNSQPAAEIKMYCNDKLLHVFNGFTSFSKYTRQLSNSKYTAFFLFPLGFYVK